MNPEITSKRLKELMESGGLNASRLATKTKGDRATIGRILRGETLARESTLVPIAKFFRVSVEYLQGIENTFEKKSSRNQVQFEDYITKLKASNHNLPKLSSKELEIFFKVLFLHQDEIRELELYQTFERSIRIDEREKAVRDHLLERLEIRKKKGENF